MWEAKDISEELNRLVNSPIFKDLELVLDDICRRKFLEIQNTPVKTADELIADRKILNFYLNFCRDLQFRLKQIEQDKIANNNFKIEESQRINE